MYLDLKNSEAAAIRQNPPELGGQVVAQGNPTTDDQQAAFAGADF